MRSTRAANAVDRLNKRLPDHHYTMTRLAEGLFVLVEVDAQGEHKKMCEPMEMDDFVAFVNKLGPQQVQKISRNDAKFEEQLRRSRGE